MGGYVYLICDPGLDTYKIGVTRNLTLKRLKKILTGNSTELHIIHSIYCEFPFRLETLLHNRFSDKRACGEWFYLTADDVLNFELTCTCLINNIKIMQNNPFFNKNLK